VKPARERPIEVPDRLIVLTPRRESGVASTATGFAEGGVDDFVEVLASVSSGNPAGAASNDFSFVRSAVFQVI
jgi:hypothetical protein